MYEIGDKIRINYDLEASAGRYKIAVTNEMAKYRGQITTIKGIHNEMIDLLGGEERYYRIDLDAYDCAWTDDMFEPVDEDIDLQALLDLI